MVIGWSARRRNETNPDYPNIPGLAIERVEIVADGASAIYGSDAIAGVVNFVTAETLSRVPRPRSATAVADDYYSTYRERTGRRGLGQWLRAGCVSIHAERQHHGRRSRAIAFRTFARSVASTPARSIVPRPMCVLPQTGATTYAAPAPRSEYHELLRQRRGGRSVSKIPAAQCVRDRSSRSLGEDALTSGARFCIRIARTRFEWRRPRKR